MLPWDRVANHPSACAVHSLLPLLLLFNGACVDADDDDGDVDAWVVICCCATHTASSMAPVNKARSPNRSCRTAFNIGARGNTFKSAMVVALLLSAACC